MEAISEKFSEQFNNCKINDKDRTYFRSEYLTILEIFECKANQIQTTTDLELESVTLGDIGEVQQIIHDAKSEFDNALNNAFHMISVLFTEIIGNN
jgi:hypothetical protein